MTLNALHECLCQWRADLDARLRRIEAAVKRLGETGLTKEHYTVSEFAKVVGRAEYTVREWARHGRLNAEKTLGGRGGRAEWRISHEELLRYQREGLMNGHRPGPGGPAAGAGDPGRPAAG